MIRLVTHATRAWVPKTAPYLASLQAYWPGEVYFLTVNCDAPPEFIERFSKVAAVRVPKVAGSPENTDSLQHGAFIDYVPGDDADVLTYTDADIVMQRIPSQAEYSLLARLPADTVACGWNSGPDETLAMEAARLFPRGDLRPVFGDLVDTAKCYNIGVIAARRSTWEAIHLKYMDYYDQAVSLLGAQQRQQWLVAWVIAALGLSVTVLPYSVHMHGCYALPTGASINGTANYNGEPVLFRHHL